MQMQPYVLAFEVLDNLPHDKVQRDSSEAPWQEAWVCPEAHDCSTGGTSSATATLGQAKTAWSEALAELQDPVIKRSLAAWAESDGSAHAASGDTFTSLPSLLNTVLNTIAGVAADAHAHQASQGGQALYVPTGALQMMEAMHAACPRHHLIAADFAWFSAAELRLQGTNAPIVSRTVRGCPHACCMFCFSSGNGAHAQFDEVCLRLASCASCSPCVRCVRQLCVSVWSASAQQHKHLIALPPSSVAIRSVPIDMQVNGKNEDLDSYLVPPGSADVFFPTDFNQLARCWRRAGTRAGAAQSGNLQTDVLPMHVFMNMYAEVARTKTMTAYNPLLDDFQNTAFLLANAMRAQPQPHQSM